MAGRCGEFAETLLETEISGHARGAFTGALQNRVGLFEAADGAPLLSNDVRDVSPALQVPFLRVLQVREVRRVGEVAQRRFRQHLYFRLRVVDVHVPPLRERVADVCVLMDRLLERVASRMERPIREYTDAARQLFVGYA